MADYKGEEFEFPDEKSTPAEGKDELDIEVVDDTPEEDRGRVPLGEEPDDIAPDEDIAKYSEEVQKRINKLKRSQHDERRQREAAQRERDAAVDYARAALTQLEQTRRELVGSQKVAAESSKEAADKSLAQAKRALAEAYESGDSEKVADAQEAVSLAVWKLQTAAQAAPVQAPADGAAGEGGRQTDGRVVQMPPTTPANFDPKLVKWWNRNPWFQRDQSMTRVAIGLHEDLVRKGIDPATDAYYTELDKRLLAVFPDRFPADDGGGSPTEPSKGKPSSIVAPAARTPNSTPKKIVITASERRIAEQLGIDLQTYAKEKRRLEINNG